MRNIGVLVLAGLALVGSLAVWAPDATAQATPGRELASTTFERAATSESPRVDMPPPTHRWVGIPDRVTVAGETRETTTSVTAIAPHTLAAATWRITRHVGLFFDYKLRFQDAAFSIGNATSDMNLKLNHVFGGITVDF